MLSTTRRLEDKMSPPVLIIINTLQVMLSAYHCNIQSFKYIQCKAETRTDKDRCISHRQNIEMVVLNQNEFIYLGYGCHRVMSHIMDYEGIVMYYVGNIPDHGYLDQNHHQQNH